MVVMVQHNTCGTCIGIFLVLCGSRCVGVFRCYVATSGRRTDIQIMYVRTLRATRQPGNSAFANISWLSIKKMKIGGAGGTQL